MTVSWTNSAIAHLVSIHEHIARDKMRGLGSRKVAIH